MPADRYYVIQCVDLFTYNFAYIGSRATGNKAGHYLFVGPDWTGETPPGIAQVFRSETQFALCLMRIQLKSPEDMPNVRAVQGGVGMRPLSAFAGTPPPPPAPKVDWPGWDADRATSFEFVGYLNLLLGFTRPDPSEKDLLARFATIGIGPSTPFEPGNLPADRLAALKAGVALGKTRLLAKEKATTSSLGLFGTRAEMKNDYPTRAVAAAKGLYGNSAVEAVYTGSDRDADGRPLDGSKHSYSLKFAPGQQPPARFFWSATVYRLPREVAGREPDRPLLAGSTTEELRPAPDGSIEILIQAVAPEGLGRANWLPAPAGPFDIVLRMYGPSRDAQDGGWQMPAIHRAD